MIDKSPLVLLVVKVLPVVSKEKTGTLPDPNTFTLPTTPPKVSKTIVDVMIDDVVIEDTFKFIGIEPPPPGVAPLIDDTTRLATFALTVERVDTPVISLLFIRTEDRNVIGEKPDMVDTWRVEKRPVFAKNDDVTKALLFKMYSVWSAGE